MPPGSPTEASHRTGRKIAPDSTPSNVEINDRLVNEIGQSQGPQSQGVGGGGEEAQVAAISTEPHRIPC